MNSGSGSSPALKLVEAAPIRTRTEDASSMSTAAFPGALRPTLVRSIVQASPSTLAGRSKGGRADLTIHRISKTHHGRTLLTLGHAAEHLANSRQFALDGVDDRNRAEAIHILMSLSRSVFEEFAGAHRRRWRLEEWLVGRVTDMIESQSRDKRRERLGPSGPGLAASPVRL